MKNVLTTAALLAFALSPLVQAADPAAGTRGASAPRATSATGATSGTSTVGGTASSRPTGPTSGTSAMSPVTETGASRPAGGSRPISPTANTSAMSRVNETGASQPASVGGSTGQAAAGVSGASSKPASQPSRMKECNDKAAGMKGDERRAMMKECLSNKTGAARADDKPAAARGADARDAKDGKQATAGKDSQQSRMKTCNAEAKGKSGDERRAFMKECLSKKAG